MTFLAPAAALLLVSLPLIVVLHLRRTRARPLPVTTLRFWQAAAQHRRERLTLRRPPRSVLLLAQLVTAALLALALARPALPLPSLPGNAPPHHLLLVLDRSVAMRAVDVAPSRYSVARDRAVELASSAPPGDQVTVLTLDANPQLLRSRDSADRPLLLAALRVLPPGGGQADLDGALPALRAALTPERPNAIVILSAGVFASAPDQAALATFPASIRWEQIGEARANVAITRVQARPSALAPERVELFASVANFAPDAVSTRSQIEADGVLVDDRALDLPAGGVVNLVWQLPRDTRGARLRVLADDALPLDNDAQVVLRPAGQVRILLVSRDSGVLGRALAAQPGAALTTVAPEDYRERERFDLTVFDSVAPTNLPSGGVLLVNPPPNNTVVPGGGRVATPAIERIDRESPLLDGVDLGGVSFAPQPAYAAPAWAREVAGSEATTLILAGHTEGREIVALTFDLNGSSLPRKLAFPLLIGNIVERLQTHRVPPSALLGAGAALEPVAGTASVQLRGPRGTTEDILLHETPGGVPAAYVTPDQPGLYALIERDGAGQVLLQESFAVNAGDPVGSNLRGVQAALPTGRGDAPPETAGATGSAPRRLGELWSLLLGLVLLLLVGEWALGLLGPRPARVLAGRVRPRPRSGLERAP